MVKRLVVKNYLINLLVSNEFGIFWYILLVLCIYLI